MSCLGQIPSSCFPTSELFFGSDACRALQLKEGDKERDGEDPPEEIALIVFWQVRYNIALRQNEGEEMKRGGSSLVSRPDFFSLCRLYYIDMFIHYVSCDRWT